LNEKLLSLRGAARLAISALNNDGEQFFLSLEDQIEFLKDFPFVMLHYMLHDLQ
jgi:hypothetical protein